MVDQDFGRQNISMSRPTLDLTPIGKNTTNETISPIDLIPVGTKMPEPTPLTRPTELPEKTEKRTYQGTWIHTHHCQTHHRINLICRMIPIPVNQRKINTIRRKLLSHCANITFSENNRHGRIF